MTELRLGVGPFPIPTPSFEKEAIVAETLGRGLGAARRWLGKGGISAAQQATMKPTQTAGRFGNFLGRFQSAERMGRMGIPTTGEFTARGARKGIEAAGAAGVSPEMAGSVMYRSRLPGLGRRAVKKEMGGELMRSAYGARAALKPEVLGPLASQVLPGRAGRGIARKAETLGARAGEGGGPAVSAVQSELGIKRPLARTRPQVAARAEQFQAGMAPPPPAPRATPAAAATPPAAGGAAAEGVAGTAGAPFSAEELVRRQADALDDLVAQGFPRNPETQAMAERIVASEAGAGAAAAGGAEASAAGAEAAKGGRRMWPYLAGGAGLGIGGYMYGAGEADRRANNQMDQWLLNAGYLQQPYGY